MTREHTIQDKLNVEVNNASWYQAITLPERLWTFKSVPHFLNSEPSNNQQRGVWRLNRWKEQFHDHEDLFRQRLAQDELSEEDLLALLSEPSENVLARSASVPEWLKHICQLFSAFSNSVTSDVSLKQEPLADTVWYPEIPKQEGTAFSQISQKQEWKGTELLALAEPFIDEGCQRLRTGIQALRAQTSTIPFDDATIEELFLPHLLPRLLQATSRTLALELNIARLQNILKGETSVDRFQDFIKRLRQSDLSLVLLREYPVLARLITLYVDQWVDNSLTFLRRLCTDWSTICHTFSPQIDPGLLKQVEGNAGDPHQNGQSVIILTFASGLRLVYKPHSLSVDVHFQELLLWLNERGDHPPFKTLRVLNQDTYGWVEFAALQDCSSQEEIRRFYQRQGAYLALLYMLDATDFHHENLVAAGEYPILVDLESLFHPHVESQKLDRDANSLADDAFFNSVMRVMLLPQHYYTNDTYDGLEISGLGGASGQLSPFPVLQMEDLQMDTLHFIRKRIEMPGSRNRPTLNRQNIDIQNYADDLINGFRNMYRVLLQYRQELLSHDGPLTCFTEDEVRVILRPTKFYSRILIESHHPDVLRDALDREFLFDCLWKEVVQRPSLARAIPSEYADLQRGDVPFFTTRVNSSDMWNSTGEVLPRFFNETGLSLVHKCLLRFSEQDLERQLWFIRASLTTLSLGTQELTWSKYSFTDTALLATPDRLLKEACAVGERLEVRALSAEHETNWIGLTFVEERLWRMTPLGADLYNGLAGIIFFLAYLGKVSGEQRYTTLAHTALATLRRQLEQFRQHITGIGGFTGWGGTIYLFSHLGILWQDSTFLTQAHDLVSLVRQHVAQDEAHDVMNGAAGCIAALLSLYYVAPSQETLEALQECGDLLLTHMQHMPIGVAWKTLNNAQPLTGFSHGSAGIAWSLLKLADLTRQERFQATALQALEYERSCFSTQAHNWPDFRDFVVRDRVPGDHAYMSTWCHGAAGIALARLASLPYLKDAITREEIEVALQTTLDKSFGENHSLCHGDLGNIEPLVEASKTYSNNYSAHVTRLSSGILSSMSQSGWLCGVPQGLETPGLMVGLAGIGYGLLRLAKPELIPSVLLLEPPKVI